MDGNENETIDLLAEKNKKLKSYLLKLRKYFKTLKKENSDLNKNFEDEITYRDELILRFEEAA